MVNKCLVPGMLISVLFNDVPVAAILYMATTVSFPWIVISRVSFSWIECVNVFSLPYTITFLLLLLLVSHCKHVCILSS